MGQTKTSMKENLDEGGSSAQLAGALLLNSNLFHGELLFMRLPDW